LVIDHRTYTMHPLKLGKWLELYEAYALPVQLRHLGNLLGFFQTEIGTLNQVVHLWGFDDLADRTRRRAAMAKDPDWAEFLRRNEELGALMHRAAFHNKEPCAGSASVSRQSGSGSRAPLPLHCQLPNLGSRLGGAL
jgi:hypothetical protein